MRSLADRLSLERKLPRRRANRLRSGRWSAPSAAAFSLTFGSSLLAAPVVHEFIEGAGVPLPPERPRGQISLAEEPAAPGLGEGSGALAEAASRDTFSIDSDTAEPEAVPYSDPFTPQVTPFKRARAFDSVSSNGTLEVARPRRRAVPRGSPRSGDETFHVSFSLSLNAGQTQPLPTPGPGARVVRILSQPPASLELRRDSADNWSVRAPKDAETELTLQLSIARRAFGGRLALASWEKLARYRPEVPAAVHREAARVARALGISSEHTPTEAVTRLAEHFRGFVPSEEGASGTGLALYRELALGGRGVCRHRAYAFAVTALGMGLPARYVDNEAHAWVEVFTGTFWQRIDLGGAARHLDAQRDGRPEHVPPAESLPWPQGARPGQALARGAGSRTGRGPREAQHGPPERASQEGAGARGTAADALPAANAGAGPALPPSPATDFIDSTKSQEDPHYRFSLKLGNPTTTRGTSVLVEGRVLRDDHPCAGASIDILLADGAGAERLLGRLSSDRQGRFSGPLVVPLWASAGDHWMRGELSPGQSCSAKR